MFLTPSFNVKFDKISYVKIVRTRRQCWTKLENVQFCNSFNKRIVMRFQTIQIAYYVVQFSIIVDNKYYFQLLWFLINIMNFHKVTPLSESFFIYFLTLRELVYTKDFIRMSCKKDIGSYGKTVLHHKSLTLRFIFDWEFIKVKNLRLELWKNHFGDDGPICYLIFGSRWNLRTFADVELYSRSELFDS